MTPEDFSDIFSVFETGIRLAVKAKPGVSRARSPKIINLAGDKRAVEIAVAAIAEDGKANKAILERLAKEIGLRKKDLSIKTGITGRLKVVEIVGDASVLHPKIAAWLKELPED